MFPMRDHLYELAKVHEIELMKQARHQQQLEQARNHSYATWTLEPVRRLWHTVRRRWQGSAGSTRSADIPRLTISKG